MSAFQGTTYPQRQYQMPQNTSSEGHLALAPYDAVDTGRYFHEGYQGGHLIQEQVYGPPRSEYRQHYQDDGHPSSCVLDQSMPLPVSTAFSTSPTRNSSVASWTAESLVGQVWLPGLNYGWGWDVFPSNGGATFGSSNVAPLPISPFLGPVAEQQTAGFDHGFHGQHAGNFSHHWGLEDVQHTIHTPTPPSFPHHNSFSPSLYHGPQQRPSVGSAVRQYYGVYLPQNNSTTAPHRRKGPAHTIEYEGLRMDEEELLEGRMAPGGKITVHQCRWEEDLSPCHLWIKGDKSCINNHIQKWHGGKPGGDKLEVDCRWTTCQKKMLKESISRHVVTVHLGEKWKCQGCREEIVRKDAYERHASKEGCRDSGALIMYFADARVIDTCAALAEGEGYADA